MYDALQKVFDEHASPTLASSRAVCDRMMPVVQLNAAVQKQILEYESLLEQAMMDPAHPPTLTPKLESIRQTLGALKRDSAAAQQAFALVRLSMEQLDRYMPQAQQDAQSILDALASPVDNAATAKP